ncbi:MAG: ABC transporter permease [Dorea sp.]|jgi:ABC-type antimicrobial peptide transport system permease subunit|nr:ABC transporter permease [Dorea sp.]
MKSYLSLIPVSARVHRRQNRMTLLCIIISVFLVTAIFSVADMFVRANSDSLQEKHGNWHIRFDNISQDGGEEIGRRSDVTAVGWSDSFNTDADQPCYIGEKKAALYGVDKTYITQLVNALEEGSVPQNDNEVMLSDNAKLALDVQPGDHVTVSTPAGDSDFIVSGFGSDDKAYYRGQTYMVAVYMTRDAFHTIMNSNMVEEHPSCYVQFKKVSGASGAAADIQKQYGLADENISENTAVLGLSGQSRNKSFQTIYGIAAMLFVLVLLAGALMISGSLNSNISQRIKFFGMMRCIGASRGQIIWFVRLEALNWCKTAVPVGVVSGTFVSWGICAYMRYGIGGEFAAMQVFGLSPAGLLSGALVGIVTVLLAAQWPAKQAAKVSPMTAVSGNSEAAAVRRRAIKHKVGRIERTLGIHHAIDSRKNWFLMTASFALTIILILCFSIGMDFARGLVPSLKSWQPDITLNGYANALVIEQNVKDEINEISGVKSVFGTAYLKDIPAVSSRQGIDYINLESYDEFLMESAEDEVVEGKISDIYGESNKVMTVYNKDNPLKVGDTVQISGQEVEITCSVSGSLFPSEQLVICSQETFERLTGEQRLTMVGVRLSKDADDETIRQISKFGGSDVIFADDRESSRESNTTVMATQVGVYGFLTVIGMVTMFYIINSISISVAARTKQYGAMRAVGMDGEQLTRMITAETFTYAVSGLAVGCGIGLPLNYILHTLLITRYFGTIWHLPAALLCMIVMFVAACAIAAVYAPAKRIRNMAITDTINEL